MGECRPVTTQEPRQQCRLVPRQVCKDVKEKECKIEQVPDCKQVPTQVATQVCKNVPREVCLDKDPQPKTECRVVTKNVCEEQDYQICQQECEDSWWCKVCDQ